jgi:hypothetical protein
MIVRGVISYRLFNVYVYVELRVLNRKLSVL